MAISSQSRDIKFQAETFINLIHILSQAWNFDKSSPVKSESEMNMNKTTNGQTCFILQGSGFYKHSLDNPNLKCFLVVLFDNLLYHEAARREIRYLRIQRKTLEDLFILVVNIWWLLRIISKVSIMIRYNGIKRQSSNKRQAALSLV